MKASKLLIFLFICSSINIAWAIPTNGLVAEYSFAGNANDSSGNNINGTVYGNTTLTEDRFGRINNAYTFDGNGDYIYIGKPIPTELQMTDGFTISSWIRPDGYTNPFGDMIGGIFASQYDPEHAGYSLSLDYRANAHGGVAGGLHFQVGEASSYWTTSGEGTTSTSVAIGEWSHVVAVAAPNSTYKVYINGNLVADWSPKSNIKITNSSSLTIGWDEHVSGSTRYFDGAIDDISVYNRVLDLNEIQELYTATPVPEPHTFIIFALTLLGVIGFYRNLK